MLKEMSVFYVGADPDSGRMGTNSAYCVGFSGNSAYSTFNVPDTFPELIEHLKNNFLIVKESPQSMFFWDVIMNSAQSDPKIKFITDFKCGDYAYLGMGNFGTALGQLTVQVEVEDA